MQNCRGKCARRTQVWCKLSPGSEGRQRRSTVVGRPLLLWQNCIFNWPANMQWMHEWNLNPIQSGQYGGSRCYCCYCCCMRSVRRLGQTGRLAHPIWFIGLSCCVIASIYLCSYLFMTLGHPSDVFSELHLPPPLQPCTATVAKVLCKRRIHWNKSRWTVAGQTSFAGTNAEDWYTLNRINSNRTHMDSL